MVLHRLGDLRQQPQPLTLEDRPTPKPVGDEILVRIATCGVCHTELDEIEGRTPPPRLPIIPGHQVIGRIAARGPEARRFDQGERVGIAWIFSACGRCAHCLAGQENLCPEFQATGRDAHGGYAEYMIVAERFAFPIPAAFSDAEAAPLLCAGAVGYRSLRLARLANGQPLGLTGFGASGHLVLQLARALFPDSDLLVFARSASQQAFALELGAAWAGDTADEPPVPPQAIIDTTPAWKPVVEGLKNLAPGGRLVINAIRKEEADKEALLDLDYARHLWQEKEIKSVANVTRRDVAEFLEHAAAAGLRPAVQEYPLAAANQALVEMKTSRIHGAKVLRIS